LSPGRARIEQSGKRSASTDLCLRTSMREHSATAGRTASGPPRTDRPGRTRLTVNERDQSISTNRPIRHWTGSSTCAPNVVMCMLALTVDRAPRQGPWSRYFHDTGIDVARAIRNLSGSPRPNRQSREGQEATTKFRRGTNPLCASIHHRSSRARGPKNDARVPVLQATASRSIPNQLPSKKAVLHSML